MPKFALCSKGFKGIGYNLAVFPKSPVVILQAQFITGSTVQELEEA